MIKPCKVCLHMNNVWKAFFVLQVKESLRDIKSDLDRSTRGPGRACFTWGPRWGRGRDWAAHLKKIQPNMVLRNQLGATTVAVQCEGPIAILFWPEALHPSSGSRLMDSLFFCNWSPNLSQGPGPLSVTISHAGASIPAAQIPSGELSTHECWAWRAPRGPRLQDCAVDAGMSLFDFKGPVLLKKL